MSFALIAALATPALAAGAGECSAVPPAGHEQEIGFARDRHESDALRDAYDAARLSLVGRVCAAADEATCLYYQSHMRKWESHYDADSGDACATYVIERAALDQVSSSQAALDAAVEALAQQIIAAAPGALDVSNVYWSSGCVAPEAAYLRYKLLGMLSDAGIALGRGEGVTRAKLLLAEGPEYTLFAQFTGPTGGMQVVTSPGFPPSALSLQDGGGGDCALASIGPRGVRAAAVKTGAASVAQAGAAQPDASSASDAASADAAGAAPLEVELDLDAEDEVFCEGDRARPVLRTSAPARVQVYTLNGAGESFLLWPPQGDGGAVDGSRSFGSGGELVMLRGDAGDESLIAVAYPDESGFGDLAPRLTSGLCYHDGKLDLDALFPGASVSTVTYHVNGPGEGGCGAVDSSVEAYREAVAAALPKIPACPAP